jgi:hypothetical protein
MAQRPQGPHAHEGRHRPLPKIIVALSETIRLMTEIDQVIEAYGGWPAAFQASADAKAPV